MRVDYNTCMRAPLFSIIIPTLNEEKFLPTLLRSLVSQTTKPFEVIVVDGKSKDDTIKVAQSFHSSLPNIQIVESPKASVPYQRNLGARYAHGEWLVFVDADGAFLPYFFDRSKVFIQAYKPTVFFPWFMPDSSVAGDALFTLLSNIALEMSVVVKRQIAPGPLTIVSRAAFDAVAGYSEEHSFFEDYDFGLRLAKAGFEMSLLRETLFVYSLRRFRNEGKLRVMQQYAKGAIIVLFTKTAVKHMPGYIMGGQQYGKRKRIKQPVLKRYEKKLRQLSKELFS